MNTNHLSAQQRRVIDTDGITLIGFDDRSRPVVEGAIGIPKQVRRWAIKRDGDPTDITGDVRMVGYE